MTRSNGTFSVCERMGLLSALFLFRHLLKTIYSVETTLCWLNVMGMSVSRGIDSSAQYMYNACSILFINTVLQPQFLDRKLL